MEHREANKRLAKNTLVLYLRTFIVTIISLFISRILLKNLGVENYGIYNVVGSVVVLFSFFNSALTTSTQRFLTLALGKRQKDVMRKVFCTSLSIQVIITIVVVMIIEFLGVWFLNNKLNIPDNRMFYARVAFQFSILTFILNILRVPYSASIIAYERMDIFAYLSIIDVLIKLLISFVLFVAPCDRLIFYAILLSVESGIILLLHILLCKKKFDTCNYRPVLDKGIFSKMFSFTGWSTLGSFSNMATQNGFLFVINMFCGVIVNASMGIANQVSGALNAFVSSFQTSFYPQIIKAYAQNDKAHLYSLINRTSKLSFELMIIPALILIINIDLILDLWLVEVPKYANVFCQIILVCSILDATTGPYYCGIMATGKIRNYQLAISLSFISDIVLVYLVLQNGISPQYVLFPRIITRGILNGLIGLISLKKLLHFKISVYLKRTILPIIMQLSVLTPCMIILYNTLHYWNLFIFSSIIIIAVVLGTAFCFVLDESERTILKMFTKKILSK